MKPLARHAVLLSTSLLLQSCFTMALWGFFPTTEDDPITHRRETYLEYDDETEWSWGKFFARVLLTPVAFTADCFTYPLQKAFFDDDDEEEQRRRRRRCERRR